MKSLDTNILLRFIVRDDADQVSKVMKLLTEIEANHQQAFVSSLVILEVVWVLSFSYKISRLEIIEHLLLLLKAPVLAIENHESLFELLTLAKDNTFDLSDLLIAYHCKNKQAIPVITFDKKASKFEFFELLD